MSLRFLCKPKLILDIRTPMEIVSKGKIPYSKHIEYTELVTEFSDNIKLVAKKDDAVLVYCQTGKRSRHITWLGKSFGYNFYDLEGGFQKHSKKNIDK